MPEPSPDAIEAFIQRFQGRDLGEKLDAHRKARQAEHPDLTLTGMYNVLEKLRDGEALTDKDKKIHDQGLVTILKQIHDDLDEAVFEAYGWSDILRARRMLPDLYDFKTGEIHVVEIDPANIEAHLRDAGEAIDQELLKRLVALNHERAVEERRGLIRWLRPEYQNPGGESATTSDLPGTETEDAAAPEAAAPAQAEWPATLPEQVAAIQKLLPTASADPSALASCFGKRTKARIAKIEEILETLTALGKL